MKLIAPGVALLLFGAAGPSLSAQEPQVCTLPIVRRDDSPVGVYRRSVEAWNEPSTRTREMLTPGARSRETRASLGGVAHVFVMLWADDADVPRELAWYSPDEGSSLSRAPLEFQSVSGELKQARVALPSPDPLALELFLQAGALVGTGSWSGGATWEGHFELNDVRQLVWLIDGDSDGRFDGADDRWIAGPEKLVRKLRLQNPGEDLRPCNVPWALGEVGLALLETGQGRAQISSGVAVDRQQLRAGHYRRVQAEFEASVPVRPRLLEQQGEDALRPVVDSPAEWRYVQSFDEALASAGDGPLLLELTSYSCGWCRMLSHLTHPDAEVDALLRPLTRVRLVAQLDLSGAHQRFGAGWPTTLLLARDGTELGRIGGFHRPSRFAASLRTMLEQAR